MNALAGKLRTHARFMDQAKQIYHSCGELKPFPYVEGGLCTFGYRDNNPVGFAYVRPLDENDADIIYIGVLPEYQRQGLARELIQNLQKQYHTLYLEVETTNCAACSLYANLGFLVQRTRPNYYGLGRDAFDMLYHSTGFLEKT